MSVALQFKLKFPVATPAQAASLEKRIGAPLPARYREYMLADGGGHLPTRGCFKVQWPDGYDGFSAGPWVWFTWFLRLAHGECGIYSALEAAWRNEFGWPRNLLPIAASDAGGIVFIGIEGPVRGKIFFGYTNDTHDGAPTWDCVAAAADDFDGWLESLVPEDQVPWR